jgi:uncharacterized Zn finger protein (UPF0148 family)
MEKYNYVNLNTQQEVDEMVGETCQCGNKILKSKFNDDAYCPNCKTKWSVSKFSPKGKVINKDQAVFDEIKAIHDRIDKLGKYLEEKFESDKVVFYPKDEYATDPKE